MLLSVLICFYGKKISVSEFLRSARSSFLLFPIKKENRQRLYNLLSIFILKLIFTFYDEIFYKIRYFLIPLKNLLFPYLSEYKSRKSFIKKTFYFYLMRKMGLEPTQAQCLQDP
nr:MAG: hypothetical protein [Bacteriophage sp.]